MKELNGKTAFVTGGASGIGLALGRAFAEAGMKVMLADIESTALADALTGLESFGKNKSGVHYDATLMMSPAIFRYSLSSSFSAAAVFSNADR